MKSFDIKTKIHFGEHALDRLKTLDSQKVMIIADPFVENGGLLQQITNRLAEAHIAYSVFSDVVPDPPVEKVIHGVEKMVQIHPDTVVAVGGGSAIDLAKSIRYFALQMDSTLSARLIAIPTTSGTGSEVTSFAVVTDPSAGRKYPLCSDEMLPDEAILDEEMVKSVPPSITADTGMDVLTHAIEAYVSLNNNEFSGALAEKSVEICGQFLLRSYASNEDAHARRKMHIASCLAGLAFNSASLGLTHGIAHQLGAKFHVPHGRANAILLPHIIEYNSQVGKSTHSSVEYAPCVRKYCNIARILGVSHLNEVTTIHALVAYISFLNHEMGIPASLHEIGKIDENAYFAALDDMTAGALADATTATNPRKPNAEEVRELLRKIW